MGRLNAVESESKPMCISGLLLGHVNGKEVYLLQQG